MWILDLAGDASTLRMLKVNFFFKTEQKRKDGVFSYDGSMHVTRTQIVTTRQQNEVETQNIKYLAILQRQLHV